MSQENIEVVQAGFAAWNAGDMDAAGELLAPGAIMWLPEGWPEPGPLVGWEAVVRQWAQQRETWDADALVPIGDFIDVADHVVLRFIWRGAGHGPAADLEMTAIYTVRKGKLFLIEHFWDHAEALEAVGLSGQTMSQQNLEILGASIEAFLAGTSESDREDMLSQGAEAWDPEIELDASDTPVLDVSGVYRGKDAVQRFWREWLAAWETIQFEYELIDAGNRVVMLFNLQMRGRSTGIELPFGDIAWVFTFRDGLVVHQKLYMSQSDALAAVGLSEQDALGGPPSM